MSDELRLDDVYAYLDGIHDHEDNDLSPNDKKALCVAMDTIRELQRFREREPLVQRVIELGKLVESEDGWWLALRDAVENLASAPCITDASPATASAADPTGGEPE